MSHRSTHDDITIGLAVLNDCESIGDLHFKTHKQSFSKFASPSWIKARTNPSYIKFWCDHLAKQDPSERTWKAERGGCIVGTVSIIPLERSTKIFHPRYHHGIAPRRMACLRLMYVDPDEQRNGIGRILMEKVKGYLSSTGYQLATLITHVANKEARSFYQRMGWELDEIFKAQVPEFFPEPENMRQRARYRYLLSH